MSGSAFVQLPTQAPFHLEATVRMLQRGPSDLVDVWERDHYTRLLEIDRHPVLIEVENCNTIDVPATSPRFSVAR